MTMGTHRAEEPAGPVADLALRPSFGWPWLVGFAASLILVFVLVYALGAILVTGLGSWGTNSPFVWGFDLVNYTWWIGIANAASLFAAVLVMRRHGLRTAVNRFAEAVALFAVICAGLFPVFHLGRPTLFYWVFPYPSTFDVWPQFRSPLIWDLWAIVTHVFVTSLLWYIGLIPDLATLRDRAKGLFAKRIFGLFALGWRGEAAHWEMHQTAYRLVAALLLPLLILMQSIVALEFAVMLVPDWHQVRLPLNFVVTGLASGIAMVMVVAALLRGTLGLRAYITDENADLLARLVIAAGIASGLVYLNELMTALLAEPYTRSAMAGRIGGEYAGLFWGAVALTVALPQLLWLGVLRRSMFALVAVGIGVSVGVWLDRFSIVIGGLYVDYLPAMWRLYQPTFSEWAMLAGTVGLFVMGLLLFVRFLPVVSLFETRHAEREEPAL